MLCDVGNLFCQNFNYAFLFTYFFFCKSRYDHLSKVLCKVLDERPENVVGKLFFCFCFFFLEITMTVWKCKPLGRHNFRCNCRKQPTLPSLKSKDFPNTLRSVNKTWLKASILFSGADPGMDWFGTGPLLLTAKSCKFSLFWGYISHFRYSAPSFCKPWIRPWFFLQLYISPWGIWVRHTI